MGFLKKQNKLFREAIRYTRLNIIFTFSLDLLFYITIFKIFGILSSLLNTYSSRISPLIPDPGSLDIGQSELMISLIRGMIFRIAGSILLGAAATFIAYVVLKGAISLIIAKKKATYAFFKEFSLHALAWFLLGVIPFAFAFLLMLSGQQFGELILRKIVLVAELILFLFFYFAMIANLIFDGKVLKTMAATFLIGIRPRIFLFPILSGVILFVAANSAIGFMATQSPISKELYLMYLGAATVLIIAWLRIYTYTAIKKL